MRSLLPLSFCTLLLACGTDPAPGTAPPVPATDSATTSIAAVSWPGHYDGTLPCADCEGIATQLWVRSDSTFILRQRYIGKDSMALGTIGQWHVVNGLMTIGSGTDKPDLWRFTEKGIENVDEMGHEFESALNYTMEKLADEINDEIPRMRLKGTFTYMADAKNFQPCGSRFTWPCAGGMDQGAEEGEVPNSMNGADLECSYLKAVGQGGKPWVIEVQCSLSMGPAMEGDGADEYVFIHRVIKEGVPCP